MPRVIELGPPKATSVGAIKRAADPIRMAVEHVPATNASSEGPDYRIVLVPVLKYSSSVSWELRLRWLGMGMLILGRRTFSKAAGSAVMMALCLNKNTIEIECGSGTGDHQDRIYDTVDWDMMEPLTTVRTNETLIGRTFTIKSSVFDQRRDRRFVLSLASRLGVAPPRHSEGST